jgi:flagellar hook-associated protein 1
MAANFLNIGLSGLNASQAGLQSTSHNIANINTDGYSRQTANFTTHVPTFSGSGYIGNGAKTDAVTRNLDEGINTELRSNLSDFEYQDSLFSLASQVDDMIADPNIGLNSALSSFFTSVHNMNDDPAAAANRQLLFDDAQALTQRVSTLSSQISDQIEIANKQISSITSAVNSLGQQLAGINVEIMSALGDANVQAPNDLLDKRDQLLGELSQLVDVTTLRQENGAINIFIGKGLALVAAGDSQEIVSTVSKTDADLRDVHIKSTTGSLITITNNIQGGKLGGTLEFLDNIAIPTLNNIGKITIGLTDAINSQHQLGMDINDNLGGDFFNDINTSTARSNRVFYGASNSGSPAMNVSITDTSVLTGADYSLKYDGTNYKLVNLESKSTVATFAEPGSFPTSVAIASEGFSIEFTAGGAVANDQFKITPTRKAARDMSLAIDDPASFAWASPIRAEKSAVNTGSGEIKNVSVTDTTTSLFSVANNLNPPVEFQFTSATTYNVVNVNTSATITTGTFTPNQENDMLALAGLSYGFEVAINGAPKAGDTFTVDYNNGGISDNRNGLLIADIQLAKTMDGGLSSLVDVYGNTVSSVGSQTNQAALSRDANKTLVAQYESRRASVSGVNLDEEAAKLIQYQQSYQAAAQVISVSRQVFDTLLNSVR